MKKRKLGKTDITVSTVALGCMAFTGDSNWGPQDEQDSIKTVRAALDAGITFFDTAESYAGGKTEEILGKALGSDRKRVVVASKVAAAHLGMADIIHSCEKSLKRLGTDYLDLYQIHWPNRDIPIAETMGALQMLKSQGKIRAIGISNYGAEDIETVLEYSVASNQMAYNLLFRGIEYSILPKCKKNEIGILSYSSLAQGLLSGKYQSADDFPEGRARTKLFASERKDSRHGGTGCEALVFAAIDRIRDICIQIGEPMADVALAWLIAQPGITSVIAGGRTAKQALENARGANLELSTEVLDMLNTVTEDVKVFLGDDADPWAWDRIR